MPPPDVEARSAILELELSKRATSSRVLNRSWLSDFAADQLDGYTGAEVVSVVQAAAELARDSHAPTIGCQHLVSARHRVPPTTLAACLKQTNDFDLGIEDLQKAFSHSRTTSAASLDTFAAASSFPAPSTPTDRQFQASPKLYFAVSAVFVAVLTILLGAYSVLLRP